jgi:hypothetical protein
LCYLHVLGVEVKLQTKLEAIIYKALTNLLLAAAKKVVLDAVIDRSGDNYSGSSIDDASLKVLQINGFTMKYTSWHMDRLLQTSNAFYSVEHGEISEKRYSRFAGTNSLLTIPDTKQRSHEFNEDIVSIDRHSL